MHVPACLLCSLFIEGVVTNNGRGGYKTGGGGTSEVLPLQKGGVVENVLAMLKGGGHTTFWG